MGDRLKERIDRLRERIISAVGDDAFRSAYEFMRKHGDADDGDTIELIDKRLAEILPKGKISYKPLIEQLIFMEETLEPMEVGEGKREQEQQEQESTLSRINAVSTLQEATQRESRSEIDGKNRREVARANDRANFLQLRLMKAVSNAVSIEWGRSKLTIVGEGRAGKTALCNAICGNRFCATTSTIGIEEVTMDVHLAAISRSVEESGGGGTSSPNGSNWAPYKKPDKELETALASIAKRRAHPSQASNSSTRQLASRASAAPAAPASARVNNNTDATEEAPVTASKLKSFDTDLVMRKLASTTLNLDSSDNKKLVLSIFDFGGQSVFNVIHHLFLTRYGVYAVAFNMQDLAMLPSQSHSHSREQRSTERTCLQNIRFWLNSIVVHTQYKNKKIGVLETAPILLVGTHKDKVSDPAEHGQISTLLYEAFHNNAAWPSVVMNKAGEGARGTTTLSFFPVDNTQGRDDPVVRELMRVLESSVLAADYVHEEKPLTWLQTVDLLNAESASHLTYQQVQHCAEACGVPDHDVPRMLQFLHEMGALMWHEEKGLRDVVILNPVQYFIRPATTIICKHIPTGDDTTHHLLEAHEHCMKWDLDAWNTFTTRGIISSDMLRLILREFSGTAVSIVQLMLKFGLLVELELLDVEGGFKKAGAATADQCTQSYLVPALLPLYTNLSHTTAAADDRFTTFVVVFSTSRRLLSEQVLVPSDLSELGFLPSGLFERLIGKVVMWSQQTSSAHWMREGAVYRNMAELFFGSFRFRMSLHEELNCIQVDVFGDDPLIIHRRLLEHILVVLNECLKSLKCVTTLPFNVLTKTANLTSFNESETLLLQLEAVQQADIIPIRHQSLDPHLLDPLYSCWCRGKQLKRAYDLFISYRWSDFESSFVEALFDRLSSISIAKEKRTIAVFLDTQRLQLGRQFQKDFTQALLCSSIATPVVSAKALEKMMNLQNNSPIDNLLAEWIIMLELYNAGRVLILPLLFGTHNTATGIIGDFFREQLIEQLPEIIPTATIEFVLETLIANVPELPLSASAMRAITVKSVVTRLLSFLGFKAWEHQPSASKKPLHQRLLPADSATYVPGAIVVAAANCVLEAMHSKRISDQQSSAVPSSGGRHDTSSSTGNSSSSDLQIQSRSLASLSCDEISTLLHKSDCDQLVPLFQQKRIDGLMLMAVDGFEDLLDDEFGIEGKFRAKALFALVSRWRVDGVFL